MKFKDLKQGDYFYYKTGLTISDRCIRIQNVKPSDRFMINSVNLLTGVAFYVQEDAEVLKS